MKTFITTILVLFVVFSTNINAQSTLIISENFQEWMPTEDTDDSKCSAGVTLEYELEREIELLTSEGTVDIPVTMIKCGIAPLCESRRIEDGGATENLEGVTTGWVLLNKLSTTYDENNTIETFEFSADTLGEFIFGPIPHIDSITFAHSATGGNRGIRIYQSFDGEYWDRATEFEFWGDTHPETDSQLGEVNTVTIDEEDVYIKFTSGFKQSDGTSQFSRLHNINVYGVPGDLVSVETNKYNLDNWITPTAEAGVFNLKGNISSVKVYDILGSVIETNHIKGSNLLYISSEKNGIYVVEMRTVSGEIFVKKIIKL